MFGKGVALVEAAEQVYRYEGDSWVPNKDKHYGNAVVHLAKSFLHSPERDGTDLPEEQGLGRSVSLGRRKCLCGMVIV